MMYFLIFWSCFPAFPTDKGNQFPDNPWHDYDGDGYTENTGDCDDETPGIPAPVTYFLDQDDDSFGDPSQTHTACLNQMPANYVPQGGDCDDTDPEVYPGASRDGAGLCVRDSDGDGYGDITATSPFDPGSDCNDQDASVYPGASREGGNRCVLDRDGDGYGSQQADLPYDIGTDCDDEDGSVFPGSSKEGGIVCVQDLDGDGYGDVNPPTGFDAGSDCDDSSASTYPGSSQERGLVCVLDLDQDGFGDATATSPFDPGSDCNDSSENVRPGAAIFEPWLCGIDADYDGFADSVPSVQAEPGSDCNDADFMVYPGNNSEAGVRCVLDSDGDGFGDVSPAQPHFDSGTDCNDSDPLIHPWASELCDDVDNDCDSEVDEDGSIGAQLWYQDADSDGYGSSAFTTLSCSEQLSGHAQIAGDCDDTNSNAFPGRTEDCDAVDNDCDGYIDENVQLNFYPDGDGDGFGDSSSVVIGCTAPIGYSDESGDCNDMDGSIYPGATEVVADNIDQNCDGIESCYLDNDGDGFGVAVIASSPTVSCLLPGFSDVTSDCNDADPMQYPLAPELCNGEDDDCNGIDDDNPIGQLTWFLDGDGDGDGDATDADGDGVPDNFLIACAEYTPLPVPPTVNNVAYSATSGDCDDSNASVSSLAAELCDSTVDYNCDGHTTRAAIDAGTWYADGDGDHFPSSDYQILSCPANNSAEPSPAGYVALTYDAQGIEQFDCDDNDSGLFPGNTERCNGKLDDCDLAEDSDGDGAVDYGPRAVERDDDQDGYIECDHTGEIWTNILTLPVGWGDCQPDDADVYPGAPELCTGEVEDCDSPDYGLIPLDEQDDDGDGYVECTGFIAVTWEGAAGVRGGGDCDDSSSDMNGDGIADGYYTHPGAAENIQDPTFCVADADQDGNPDCVRWSNNQLQPSYGVYSCDYGVFITSEVGPDFKLIPAGVDPNGRYELTNDYYVMTTEVTQAMYEELIQQNPSTQASGIGGDYPVDSVTYEEAAAFANALSAFQGLDECYDPQNSFEPESLYSGRSFYNCPGYRLPTMAEWDFAARSGTATLGTNNGPKTVWTIHGGGLVDYSSNHPIHTVDDGVGSPLTDYAWFFFNNSPVGTKRVSMLEPNDYGIYDMIGNAREYIQHWSDKTSSYANAFNPFPSYSGTTLLNPVSTPVGISRVAMGGAYGVGNANIGVEAYSLITSNDVATASPGFRLVRTAD